MKTLYFELNMGAAGDMLMASLLELHPDRDHFLAQLNGLGIPGVKVVAVPSVKCGITGTSVSVTVHGDEEESLDDSAAHHHSHSDDHHHHGHHHDHHEHGHNNHHHDSGHHHHAGMAEIEKIIRGLELSEKVRGDILAVYRLIADAESTVHGKPVELVHFHEVGAMDAVADITAVCMLMDELAPDTVLASPIHVGSGQVRCAHGILPVPAPATAHILKGIPIYGGTVKGELCTPTGAALLKYFVQEFGPMPTMCVSSIGYGMGHKDFEAANCVRANLGA